MNNIDKQIKEFEGLWKVNFQTDDNLLGKGFIEMKNESMMIIMSEQIKQSLLIIQKETARDMMKCHNANILNEFQNQGTADMPFIAYDERVCLIPAIEKAEKMSYKQITGEDYEG